MALSMTSRWEINRSRNSPGWIARGSTPLSGSTLRVQHSDVDQWRNPEKFKLHMLWWTEFCGFFYVFLLHPWLKQWSDLVSYQVLSSRLILPCGQNKTMLIISYPERSPLSTQGSHLVISSFSKVRRRYNGIYGYITSITSITCITCIRCITWCIPHQYTLS